MCRERKREEGGSARLLEGAKTGELGRAKAMSTSRKVEFFESFRDFVKTWEWGDPFRPPFPRLSSFESVILFQILSIYPVAFTPTLRLPNAAPAPNKWIQSSLRNSQFNPVTQRPAIAIV